MAVLLWCVEVYGAKSEAVLRDGSRALAEVLPNSELRELESVGHNVKMQVLAPVLTDFLAREEGRRHPARADAG